ncbi:hypothetical protein DVH24_041525 [Malus domestica]|uniref:Apple domain-containing protein n=1 Tax=Malus domestica TaxID=3750 RepID=A0A498I9E4_MALDO|nr:hypothetical protein DVH24_041525 [Malus domestica]
MQERNSGRRRRRSGDAIVGGASEAETRSKLCCRRDVLTERDDDFLNVNRGWWNGTAIVQGGLKIYTTNDKNKITLMWDVVNPSIISRIIVMDSFALIKEFTQYRQNQGWNLVWSEPLSKCEFYGWCGAFSICDPLGTYGLSEFECKCFPGFQPLVEVEWNMKMHRVVHEACGNGEGFIKVANVRTPYTSGALVDTNASWKQCEDECLRNCCCLAYTKLLVGLIYKILLLIRSL